MLAPFVVTPIAGVAADRINRKHILIGTDLLRAVVVFGFLFVRDAGDVWMLYTLTALQLGISGFFFPARNAILPDIVPRRQLGTANALSSVTWSVMFAFGTALGGLVSGGFGAYPAFVIDGLTFLVSALILTRIHYEHTPSLVVADSRKVFSVLNQYADGLRYLRSDRDVLNISLQKALNSLFFAGGFQVIVVILGERVFVLGDGGGISMGLLFAVTGIGTGVGPILLRRYTGDRDRALRIAIGLSYFVAAVGIACAAPLVGLGLVLVGMFLRGFGGGVIWVFSTQLLLQLVPDNVRGRVFATEFAMFTLASAISAALTGYLLDNTRLGLQGVMWGMALFGLVPGTIWLWQTVRRQSAPASEIDPKTHPLADDNP